MPSPGRAVLRGRRIDADGRRRRWSRAVHRIIDHADAQAPAAGAANADTPEDAARARRFGAEGIGLCRTEHMFLGERRELRRAADPGRRRRRAEGGARRAAAAAAQPTSSRSSRRWTACRSPSGCSTRRCTSSCPTSPSCRCGSRSPRPRGEQPTRHDLRLLAGGAAGCTSRTRCSGLRGVRLGLVIPGLFAMQVRAIAEAAAAAARSRAATRVRRS